ncbi:MAG: ROK family protein [Ignavibacteriaceae bacterium]|nr:ROK family protein [Ignavibacteriaceae bacterium]
MPRNEQYAIGVDLGGTSIKLGIVSRKGKIIKKVSKDTRAAEGPQVIIKQMLKGITALLEGEKFRIEGIGIGAPGVVSSKKGTVENAPNLPGWGKVHLGKIISDKTGLRCVVENDANAAAIGEMIFGSGKNYDSFVMVTLGTGVGGGIILNKKLFKGEFGAAGELGHITIDHAGHKCNCGSYGCIEAYLGNSYLIERVKERLEDAPESMINRIIKSGSRQLSPEVISEAAAAGDPFAVDFIRESGRLLGYAMASVSNLLDVSTIIIGGGVAGFGKTLTDSVKEGMTQRVLKSLQPRVKVLRAKLKNEAGIKGASSLVFYK